MRTKRTHDSFYLQEKPNMPPKESFKFIENLIRQDSLKTQRILDIGCANGAFPNYLKKSFPNYEIEGMELLKELVLKAQESYPHVKFFQGSVLSRPKKFMISNYDSITALGLISIFDNLDEVFKNIMMMVKPGGKIYIHGMFNRYDLDVFIKYRKSSSHKLNYVESGWNIVSFATCERILEKLGAAKVELHDFNLEIDLARKDYDEVRSWTVKLEDGQRIITNGLCLIQPQAVLEITA